MTSCERRGILVGQRGASSQHACCALETLLAQHSEQCFIVRISEVSEIPGGAGADEARALELRRIDVGGHIVISMYVTIRPVVEIDRGDPVRAVRQNYMIAARGVLIEMRKERFFPAFRCRKRVRRRLAAGMCKRLCVYVLGNGLATSFTNVGVAVTLTRNTASCRGCHRPFQ